MPAVSLRAVAPADLPVFFSHQADPEACRVAAWPGRDREAFLAHWERTSRDPENVRWTVAADGAAAGYVGSFPRDGLREVCYWLGREFWGRGIATEALKLLLAREPRRPLHARVARTNGGSIKVLERAGFVRAGEDSFEHEGRTFEEYVYRLG